MPMMYVFILITCAPRVLGGTSVVDEACAVGDASCSITNAAQEEAHVEMQEDLETSALRQELLQRQQTLQAASSDGIEEAVFSLLAQIENLKEAFEAAGLSEEELDKILETGEKGIQEAAAAVLSKEELDKAKGIVKFMHQSVARGALAEVQVNKTARGCQDLDDSCYDAVRSIGYHCNSQFYDVRTGQTNYRHHWARDNCPLSCGSCTCNNDAECGSGNKCHKGENCYEVSPDVCKGFVCPAYMVQKVVGPIGLRHQSYCCTYPSAYNFKVDMSSLPACLPDKRQGCSVDSFPPDCEMYPDECQTTCAIGCNPGR